MDNRQKTDLKGLDSSEITEFFNSLKLPNFRVRQLIHWIYEKTAKDIDEITVFSKSLRDELSRVANISNIEQINVLRSTDGSEKFLFQLEDGNFIESILMPDDDRLTLCISTQIGCAMGCRFCRTASIGFIRNLYAHEIVDQVISVARSKTRPTNIVFMGMGEPLMNINEVTDAINRLVSWMAFSPKRITLSTVGIVKRLETLYDCIPPVNLAISLNAPDNQTRDYLMPINKSNPIEDLIQTLKSLPIKKGRRITFEYVLLKDINDTIKHAENLYKIIKGIPCKINLIPFNSYEGAVFERPPDDVILAFQDYLIGKGLTVFIRKSRGADILGACGQLVGSYTNKLE
ncbi:MAG: 23S rRNA (adenine(2503)-C(2))-methyltransferase RlmN [Thermodesulfovibrionales bacterium]|nr:23S rRNA (adenine(2503)-C(2))-methyltransferase RlmN [Thermodesulfovibrionales bacterium]